jgi:hypothetical protein
MARERWQKQVKARCDTIVSIRKHVLRGGWLDCLPDGSVRCSDAVVMSGQDTRLVISTTLSRCVL